MCALEKQYLLKNQIGQISVSVTLDLDVMYERRRYERAATSCYLWLSRFVPWEVRSFSNVICLENHSSYTFCICLYSLISADIIQREYSQKISHITSFDCVFDSVVDVTILSFPPTETEMPAVAKQIASARSLFYSKWNWAIWIIWRKINNIKWNVKEFEVIFLLF